jgi:glycyl-tRNA synthetase
MFKTNQGIITNDDNVIYLRPETAQGIFINFANIQRTLRLKLPFAVGQIGKAFRNEITPGNFIFRTREFEQMELEYFCDEATADNLYQQQINRVQKFIIDVLHLDQQNVRLVTHTKEQLSHYAQATVDLQYRYLHG